MAKILMIVLIGACGLTALYSFSQTHHLLTSGSSAPSSAGAVNPLLRLRGFLTNAADIEQRILELEQSIKVLAGDSRAARTSDGASAASASTSAGTAQSPAPAAASESVPPKSSAGRGDPTVGAATAAPVVPTTPAAVLRFRQDNKCGAQVAALPDGGRVECNPDGEFPCCSGMGWCGNSRDHCACQGCVDYRASRHVARLPPPPPPDGHKGKTVLVIIPFRDREDHLVLFKKYWRWFAKEGQQPPTVHRWEVFVVEQFDAMSFNRGWNFNVGLAVASAQTSASPEIASSMGFDFDCAVIQDIDYLPEKGVDYGECSVPTQLSAEIDRYGWKTPYMASAGGIVSMNLKHWREINGFGNDYFGWGGEDDELFHRLRLNNLLYGDCYPFCVPNDANAGRRGISIKRPKPGHGRFSGSMMHSANHTKRITDSKAYARNIELLTEIQQGSDRWRSDGLSNLAFRILDQKVDTTDKEEYGITYHHLRVRCGRESFDVSSVTLVVPRGLCQGGQVDWVVTQLGAGIPADLTALRERAAAAVGYSAQECSGARGASFLLVDRRKSLAKVLWDGEPRLLVVFLRSLVDPPKQGLIIVDPRPVDEIRQAFQDAGAFLIPPTEYTVCTSPLPQHGPKYSIHQGSICSGGGWQKVSHGGFWAYARARSGMEAISFCDNKRYWTQRMVLGTSCAGSWAGLEWAHGETFWVPPGSSFCVGSRQSSSQEASFSRILPHTICEGEGFKHALSFASVSEKATLPARALCIGVGLDDGALRMTMGSRCFDGVWQWVTHFAARASPSTEPTDLALCVASRDPLLRAAGACGAHELFSFAVPRSAPPRDNPQGRLQVCAGGLGTQGDPSSLRTGGACAGQAGGVDFWTPGPLELAASTPLSGAANGGTRDRAAPLYILVEEEVPCFGFLCPNIDVAR